MIIAVDGPAGAGKGTIGRRLAAHYQLGYLDTGLLYRAVAHAALAAGASDGDSEALSALARALDINTLNESVLRTAEIGAKASKVAAHAGVRAALLQRQRDFANQPAGAVLDGRDIGTVVCPNAPVKLFVTAALVVRAQRRAAELRAKGHDISDEMMAADLAERDARDSSRADAPMRTAKDAAVLDTTHLSKDAAYQAALDIVRATLEADQTSP